MWRLMLVGSLIAAPCAQALAWGDDGHRIVCEIAMLEMAPTTRAEVEALIATDQQFTAYPGACTWADHPRKRDDEHYVVPVHGFETPICAYAATDIGPI
jgi:hypothetical protein